MEPWAQRVLKGECQFLSPKKSGIPRHESGSTKPDLKTLVNSALPGKQGPIWSHRRRFDAPESVSPGRAILSRQHRELARLDSSERDFV